jgi:hypothetical protein
MRSSPVLASLLLVAACGGGDSSTPDAASVDAGLPNEGFVAPDHKTMANMDHNEIGDADWTCLNTPSADVATTVPITLTGTLTDFQSGNTVSKPAMAAIEAFAGIDYTNVVDTSMSQDLNASFSLTLPAGHTRWGFKVTDPDYMDTFLLNQYYTDAMPNPVQDIAAISTGTAAALPALIGLQRTPGSGVLAGAFRDCSGHEVSYAVATVTTNSCAGATGTCDPMHLAGAQTFYIDSGAGIPVHHENLNHTDTNGLFAVLQLPATTTAYVQIWGFVDDADLADGQMTLLSELQAPVLSDTVITGSLEAVRTN